MAISIKIDDALKARLQSLAETRQRSPHWIMREAITQYVTREEARESFINEAVASWTSYQQTGLHLTGEEVNDWLDSWGRQTETNLPCCHEQ